MTPDQVDACVAARGWLAESCDVTVDTGVHPPDEVARKIVDAV